MIDTEKESKISLSIITPVLVQNKEAAKRLSQRFELFAEFLTQYYEGVVEWIVLVEESHKRFRPKSEGLSDPVFKVIYTPTKKSFSQAILKNIGIQLASGDMILVADQDYVITPLVLTEIFSRPFIPGNCGVFPYYQGGILRPEETYDCMLFQKTVHGPYFDERFVGGRGEKYAFLVTNKFRMYIHSQGVQRIIDNYHRYQGEGHFDQKDLEEMVTKNDMAPEVTDSEEFFTQNV